MVGIEGSIFRKGFRQGQITSIVSLLSSRRQKQLRKGRAALVHSLRVQFLVAGQAQHQELEGAVRCTYILSRWEGMAAGAWGSRSHDIRS